MNVIHDKNMHGIIGELASWFLIIFYLLVSVMVRRSMTAWRLTEHNICQCRLCHYAREDQPALPVDDSPQKAMYTEELHYKQ